MKNRTAGLLFIHVGSAEDFLSPHSPPPFFSVCFKQSRRTQISSSLLIPFEIRGARVCGARAKNGVKGKVNINVKYM